MRNTLRTSRPTGSRDVLLTPDELADRWQLSPRTLANKRSAGTGIPFMRLGGRVRYRLIDVEACESAGLVTA